MPEEIYLLKVGMTMTEGMVSEWYIADGGQVKKGEMLYALETEKVNMDVDAEFDGTVKHLVAAGETMEPGDVVGFIFAADEAIPADLGAPPAKQSPTVEAAPSSPAPEIKAVAAQSVAKSVPADGRVLSTPAARRLAKELGVDVTALTGTGPGGRIVEADVQGAGAAGAVASPATASTPPVKASPLARRLAEQKGVNIALVKGSGPGGRIVEADIEAAALAGSAPGSGPAAGETIAIKGMRKTIAQRMFASLENTAQLTMDMQAPMDDAVRLRESLIEEWQGEQIRPTYTDLVVKAVAKALRSHPLMNSQLGETEITLLSDIHVGIAVAVSDGLVVPVIRNADQLSVREIAVESSRLAALARDGALGLDDYAGGTFTVSALGMYGVDSFTPIINSPQSGILGVNRIYDGVEWEGDRPVKAKKMNLSLTWDHQVLDGAPAAEFLKEVCNLLANPYRLLV